MSKPQNANAQLYFDDLWHPGEARPAYHGNRTFAWKHQAVTSLQNHRRIVDPNQSIRDRYKLTHTDPKPLSTEKATWLDLKSWLARELKDTREAVLWSSLCFGGLCPRVGLEEMVWSSSICGRLKGRRLQSGTGLTEHVKLQDACFIHNASSRKESLWEFSWKSLCF